MSRIPVNDQKTRFITNGSVYSGTYMPVAAVSGPSCPGVEVEYNRFRDIFNVPRRDQFGEGREARRIYELFMDQARMEILEYFRKNGYSCDLGEEDAIGEYFVVWLVSTRGYDRVEGADFHIES